MKVCIIGAAGCYTCDVDTAKRVLQFIKDEQFDNEPLVEFIDDVLLEFNMQQNVEIDELYSEFKRQRKNIAVIGSTIGIITL